MLNAHKTEIQFNNIKVREVEIKYFWEKTKIQHSDKIKINGINFTTTKSERTGGSSG